jgi:hypothetical protein
MKHLPTILTTAAILASTATARVKADLIVNDWIFGTGISDYANSLYPSEFSSVVQNPFNSTHSVTLGLSSATASYDFAWLLDDAHFDITTSHHLAQLDGQTGTSGRIYLTPSVDSLVTFSGNWQYAWPSAALGNTHVSVQLGDLDEEISVLSVTGSGGNVGVGPPFGSFTLSDSGFLLANHNYLLFYTAQVRHFDPTPPGTFGEASGEFHFTITPIPEPAAALLLALPFLAIRSRRLRSLPSRRPTAQKNSSLFDPCSP